MEEFILKGSNGILTVYEDRAVISRNTINGVLYQGVKGEKSFFYSSLSSIEYKKPSFIANGYIKFITAGTIDHQQNAGLFGISSSKSLKDPNTLIITYSEKTVNIANEIYEYVLNKIRQSKTNDVSTQNNIVNNTSCADEILKFKNLLDKGIITQEEFNKKKKELLNS